MAAWQATLPQIDFTARASWLATHLATLQARGVMLLCATDAEDRAFGLVTIDASSGELDQLAVAPHAFGRGVATALLAEAKRLAPGFARLTVNQDNPRAVAFYRREGFRIVGQGANPNSGLQTWDLIWP